MRLALMQPYFFPYLGYFSLMHAVDEFVFFDTVKYQPKSWMTRNRLLNQERNGTIYCKPALKRASDRTELAAVSLNNASPWREAILSQLQHHKKAPFFRETARWLQGILCRQYTTLAELNCATTQYTAEWLGITCKISGLKEKQLTWQSRPPKAEWGLWLAGQMGATAYLNAPGGASFISHEPFAAQGVRLGFIQPQLSRYYQANDEFIPALSVLDALIWNGREKTGQLAGQYHIDWKN